MASSAMKPSEVLREARKLITPEGAWIKGKLAQDCRGNFVWPEDKGAVCFCARGALWHVGPRIQAAQALESIVGPITAWNDACQRTHAEVLAAFDRAAELAEAEEAGR